MKPSPQLFFNVMRCGVMLRMAWLLALGVLNSCQSPTSLTSSGLQPVTIVSSLVRTGSANAQTSHIVRGIRLALSEAHFRAGDRPVHYEDWDDASSKKGDWDPEVEAANAARAARNPRVVAYIGPYNSGAAKISVPVLNRAGLATVSPVVTYPGLTKAGVGELHEPRVYRPTNKTTFFRVVPTDELQGEIAAQWLVQMGGKKVWVLDDLQLYGRGIATMFVSQAKAQGIHVLAHESLDARAPEYRSLVAKMKHSDPDWIFYGGTTQTNAAQLCRDVILGGLRANVMLPDGCFEEALIDAIGPELAQNRVFLTFGGVPPAALSGVGADFVSGYRKTYGIDPDVYAVYGYAATQAVLSAIAASPDGSREQVRSALAQYIQHDGPLGDWHFDAHGDTSSKTMSGNVIRDGRFTFLTLLGGDTQPSP